MPPKKDIPKPEEENIRYVQIQDPSSGWPTMVKTVREADVNKIDDCKDDIDTLLVFAGLYSAVLSAFIIESYTKLQQDNQDVMVGLMRQLVAQNFTSGPGFLNSTTPVPELPPFEPPLWAIRVNVLWFVSLILSLSAASFGMLVKQWLREYLALEYTTPQQRLRARQFRSPALSKWKVFEIAAFLPVLLQLSLGLFFVGLCFFTSAVHNSVKKCTIPVVCAWVFFLFVTTIAPLFSPRCPFKTTFLKATLKVGRRYAAPSFRYPVLLIIEAVLFLGRGVRRLLSDVSLFLGRSVSRALKDIAFSPRFRDIVTMVHNAISPLREHVAVFLRHLYGALRETWDLTAGAHIEVWKRHMSSKMTDSLAEEEDLVKQEQEDTEILSSIDALMSDDGLLPVMVDAVQQHTGPADVLAFVLQIIGRRIGQAIPTRDLTHILELDALSKRAWSITTDAVATTLSRYHPLCLTADSPAWVYDAAIILLARSPYTLSQLAVGALRDTIAQDDSNCVELGKRLAGSTTTRNRFPGLSQQLLQLCGIQNATVSPRPLMQIYIGFLCPDHQHSSLFPLLNEHGPEGLPLSSASVLNDLSGFLISLSRWILSTRREVVVGEVEMVQIILQYGDKFGKLDAANSLCAQMMLDWTVAYWLISHFAGLHSKIRVSAEQEHVLMDAYLLSGHHDQDRIVNNMIHIMKTFCSGAFDDHTMWYRMDFVRLCQLQLKIYFAAESRSEDVWGPLWTQCARAVARYHEISGWNAGTIDWYWLPNGPILTPDELLRCDEGLASECLSIIAAHPESQAENRIPTELVAALWLFTTPEAKQRFEELRQVCHLATGDSSKRTAEQDDDGEDDEAGAKSREGVESNPGDDRGITGDDGKGRKTPQESIDTNEGLSASRVIDMGVATAGQGIPDISQSGGEAIGGGA